MVVKDSAWRMEEGEFGHRSIGCPWQKRTTSNRCPSNLQIRADRETGVMLRMAFILIGWLKPDRSKTAQIADKETRAFACLNGNEICSQ
ncbi:hypothetical protein OF122_01640 [Pelagibacterium flavum]|uniref:Uncharacterized protein n=1 Tax=Pelagibacterium flavum TaxID=2984530 RepID=A0ABY6ISY9_9HYPH|nr:hypothetical protein [Pelagibacterium sp. YIM 151497]UYQ72519.1 hypothetical protein OF122_01640 [Pelagibacterium sp. YIM 151497]|tara:strand:+ start:317 stop:583 length:267 start_codon:yes stop_codon:yes gene_type:complete